MVATAVRLIVVEFALAAKHSGSGPGMAHSLV